MRPATSYRWGGGWACNGPAPCRARDRVVSLPLNVQCPRTRHHHSSSASDRLDRLRTRKVALPPRHIGALSVSNLPRIPLGRGRFAQAPPAVCPAASRCQAQAYIAGNKPNSHTATHCATLCSPAKAVDQTLAGLKLRAGAASWAAPRSPPPRGLACLLRYAHARMHAATAGPRPCAAARSCAAAAAAAAAASAARSCALKGCYTPGWDPKARK